MRDLKEVLKELKGKGFIVFQTKDKEAPWDIVAINPEELRVKLIQVNLKGSSKGLRKLEQDVIDNEKLLINNVYRVEVVLVE